MAWSWASSVQVYHHGTYPFLPNAASTVDPLNKPFFDFHPLQNMSFASPMRTFGGYHPGGCLMAMADGSVHFVFEGIDLATWRTLGARNDGAPLGGARF